MKIFLNNLLIILFCFLSFGCLTYRDFSLGPLPEPLNWKKYEEPKYAYRAFSECEETSNESMSKDAKDEIIAKCMYMKGYRFIPEFGWCWRESFRDSYICKNKHKYAK